MSFLFEGLNEAQKKVVLHKNGPLLVIAGAGSGKTKSISHRIAYLVEQGVAPEKILAITFTNKAAEEMKNRLSALLGKEAQVWVGTFHGTCLKILRKGGERLGYARDFAIYDDSDQMTLIKECMEGLQIQTRAFHPRAILSRIDGAKNQLITPEKYLSGTLDFFEQRVGEIYAAYQKKLFCNNAMDFGDLLMKTVLLFEQSPSVLNHYQELFRYLMVDEYQDTNAAQYRLIKLLSEKTGNLCVVGDDDQSIYAWRGADINNILSFEKDFPGTKVIRLEQNYRSTGRILKIASELVRHNFERKEKTLWTQNEEGQNAVLYVARDEKDEARFVVSEIQKVCDAEGKRLNDFAIFYRTNAQSRTFEEEMRKSGMPYIIYGGVRFYDRMEVKDALAYLRALINPKDSLSLKRIINAPARGIGKKTIEALEGYASQHDLPLRDALAQVDQISGIGRSAKESLKRFGDLLTHWTQARNGIRLADFVKKILDESGYQEELEKQDTLEAENRLENLQELLTVVEDYQRSHSEGTLGEFLEQVALVGDTDNFDPARGVVPMMTLHLAKGLEFPVVFLVGMEEGLFPHSRSVDEPAGLEEERRLCYVGITRAMKRVYLSHALKRHLYGGDQFSLPSRFFDELPSELVEKRSDGEDLASPAASEEDYSQIPPSESDFRVGSHVRHPTFGIGVVKRYEGKGEREKVTVYFQDGRIKTLMVRFAGLQIL